MKWKLQETTHPTILNRISIRIFTLNGELQNYVKTKIRFERSEFGFVSNYGVRNSKNYSAKGLFVSFWSITKENRQPAFVSFCADKMKEITFSI